jgi:GWxTD domain-containing protein
VKRIHRLLYPRTTAAWAPFLAVLILVLTGAATVGAWPAKFSQSNAVAKQQETERALEPAYSKWLHEDVAYIFDQAKRAAFLALATNEERDKFIEHFWERRNPSPGAPNEFKEEHYRRLAYANGHFASGVPGWQTDRGHIYILYGPPDEKESHPQAAGGSAETWLYHHVSGVGDNATITFVDSTGRGDFRLSPGAPFVPKSPGPGGKKSVVSHHASDGSQIVGRTGKEPEKIDTTHSCAHNPLRFSNASQSSPVLHVPLSGSSVRVYEN